MVPYFLQKIRTLYDHRMIRMIMSLETEYIPLLFFFALIPLIIPDVFAYSCAAEYLEPGELCIDEFATLIEDRSPYQQLKEGINPKNIICNDGRELAFKVSNNLPVCMFPDSVIILTERGFIKN